jgi:hypothetical protein
LLNVKICGAGGQPSAPPLTLPLADLPYRYPLDAYHTFR